MATGAASTIWKTFAVRRISRMLNLPTAAHRARHSPRRIMIEARHFVEAARGRGFHWYAGVPCSYLTPFINYVLQDSSLRYVSAANEGDAVALIAGVALGASGVHKA